MAENLKTQAYADFLPNILSLPRYYSRWHAPQASCSRELSGSHYGFTVYNATWYQAMLDFGRVISSILGRVYKVKTLTEARSICSYVIQN